MPAGGATAAPAAELRAASATSGSSDSVAPAAIQARSRFFWVTGSGSPPMGMASEATMVYRGLFSGEPGVTRDGSAMPWKEPVQSWQAEQLASRTWRTVRKPWLAS